MRERKITLWLGPTGNLCDCLVTVTRNRLYRSQTHLKSCLAIDNDRVFVDRKPTELWLVSRAFLEACVHACMVGVAVPSRSSTVLAVNALRDNTDM